MVRRETRPFSAKSGLQRPAVFCTLRCFSPDMQNVMEKSQRLRAGTRWDYHEPICHRKMQNSSSSPCNHPCAPSHCETVARLYVLHATLLPHSFPPSLPRRPLPRRAGAGPHIWDKLNGAALSAALWLGRCGCEGWGGAGLWGSHRFGIRRRWCPSEPCNAAGSVRIQPWNLAPAPWEAPIWIIFSRF